MPLLEGKKGIIFGVANEHSLAWHCAQRFYKEGAELAFTCLDENTEKKVKPLLESINSDFLERCDVTDEAQIQAVFDKLKKQWGRVDFVIHSVAYADPNELSGHFVDTSRDGFKTALDVSTYSLISVCKYAVPLMRNGGSIVTLSYYGAEKVVPTYNVMGVAKAALESAVRYLAHDLGDKDIRVNAISAGVVKTVYAMGIAAFREVLQIVAETAPLKRNVSADEIAQSVLFLASDLSTGMTGEIMHVDCGASIMAHSWKPGTSEHH